MKTNIPILSFFSGGGFLDIGFEQAGFKVVWSNENDEMIADIYEEGMSSLTKSEGIHTPVKISNRHSIAELSSKNIIEEAFGNKLPKVFGIIGGPPCQDFTINGNMRGFNGDRGKLTQIYIDKVLQIKPTFFLMENVPGLVEIKSAKNKFEILVKSLSSTYVLFRQKLNALNFGVPQSRERLFVVGILKNIIPFDELQLPLVEKYKNPLKDFSWPLTNSFREKIRKPKNIPIELCVTSCLAKKGENTPNIDEFFTFRNDKNKRILINEGETNRPSFRRLHRYRYSPTASYGNNEVHMHPFEDRRISLREALRIQGVPDTYILPKSISLTKKFKVVGNGVPVPLARAIAKAIKLYLTDNNII